MTASVSVHPRPTLPPSCTEEFLSRLEEHEDTWVFGEPWEILMNRCGEHELGDLVFSAGWDECGQGHSRTAFTRPDSPWVLKIGMPHVNRRENAVSTFLQGRAVGAPAAWQASERDAARVPWVSQGGYLLLMERAERTLSEAMNREQNPLPHAEVVQIRRRFEDLGFRDVRSDNLGWFAAERNWKMIDLGETHARHLNGET